MHGVTDHTAGLVYEGQSGALSESISDVFACVVEQWLRGQGVEEADWVVGRGGLCLAEGKETCWCWCWGDGTEVVEGAEDGV